MTKDADEERNDEAREDEEEERDTEALEDEDSADDEHAGEEDDEDEADEPYEPPARVRRGPPVRSRRKQQSSSTRNIILFVVLVGGLALAFGLLGSRGAGMPGTAKPKWKVGQTVTVELTLVTTDYKDLACAMKQEVKGQYCAYEAENKRRSKGADSRKDPNVLQPYTTVDNIQLIASGVWTSEALKKKLEKENWDRPSPRFSVKCRYKVESVARGAKIQWGPGKGWIPANGWYVGHVESCKLGS